MKMKISYNNKDVTNDMDITNLLMYDRLGGAFDNVILQYPCVEKEGIKLGISKDDTIEIETDDFASGVMYVDDFMLDANVCTIIAVSCSAKNKNTKSRIWRNVRLMEVMNDVAKNYGLTLKTYNIIDYSYETISQINETDMAMLDRICRREGYSIKVDNGCLIVFADNDMESKKSTITINEAEVRKGYTFQTSKLYKSYTVSYYDATRGLISFTQSAESVVGISYTRKEYLSDINEAMRFARGYLKDANKKAVVGNISIDYNPAISAGTVIDLAGFADFDGKYIVFEATQDVIAKVTQMKVRRCSA